MSLPLRARHSVASGVALLLPALLTLAACGGGDETPLSASAAAFTTAEDTPLEARLEGSGPEGKTLVFRAVTQPAHGTLEMQEAGGVRYTPAPDYAGEDRFTFTVGEGTSTSEPAEVVLTITPVEDAPRIIGQQVLSTPEDTPLTLSLQALQVMDPDGPVSSALRLVVEEGAGYTFADTTVTPAADLSGTLRVVVRVEDGSGRSAPFPLQVEVTPVNDAPVVQGQAHPLSTPEDTPLTLTAADLRVSDVDDALEALTLQVLPGEGFTWADGVLTPAQDFHGTLTLEVEVHDGETSVPAQLEVTVTPVNDAPRISAQAHVLTLDEDTSLALSLQDVVVEDVDSSADSFSLQVLDGRDYGHSGNTVTPAADFHGALLVQVAVSDGETLGASYGLFVTVAPVNDAPTIAVQARPLSTPEDTAFTVVLEDVVVQDVDSSTFTLTVLDGVGYTHVGNAVTPAADFTGPLTVAVRVDDGEASSPPFALQVTVTPVNDAPVITAQAHALSTAEDTALTLSLADVTATDVDSNTLSLTVLDGTGYTHVGNAVTPAADFHGALQVQVAVSDGQAQSAPFTLAITVTPVNDAPVISAQAHALTTAEDTALTLTLADVTVSDVDSATSSLVLAVQPGTNYTLSGNCLTPAADFHGTLTVPVVVRDGTDDSAPFALTVTVTPVNDAPVITSQAHPLTTAEDTALTLTLQDVEASDVDGSTGLSLVVLAGTGYTQAGATLTPVQDFNGTLQVQVAVSDGQAQSAPFTLQVSVTSVNDAPVITAQARARSTPEDTALTLVLADVAASDVDSTSLTLVVLDGTGYTHAGNSVTPAQDFNGSLQVQVAVSDGEAQSTPFAFTVTVTPVNDAPVITAQAHALTTDEDTPLTLSLADLTVGDVDDAPGTLSLVVGVGSNYTRSGTTLTPKANFSGTLSVPVQVSDGKATSASFIVTVTVTPVNDAPVITGQARAVTTAEDTVFTPVRADVTATDVDSTSLTLVVLDGSGYTDVGNAVTPGQDFNGTLQVRVAVSDGQAQSAPFLLQVTVTPVNDAPVITAQARSLSTSEDTAFTPVLADVTVSDVDSTSFTLTVLDGTGYTHAGNTVTPDLDFNGTLRVRVSVSDGAAQSAPFELAVTVGAVNDAPVITAQARPLTTLEDTAFTPVLADVSVVDADHPLSALSLLVLDGTGYTHVGNTVTPAANFNGTLGVRVAASDGQAQSAPFTLQVTVTPVNDAPVISAQARPVTTLEDTAFTPVLADVAASDVEGSPLTLVVLDGTDYTHAGNTVTPKRDFSGTLQVRVAVSDGEAQSVPFLLQVTVTAVNDAPVIVSHVPFTTAEDVPVLLTLDGLTVTDVDSPQAVLVLQVQDGPGYTHQGNVVTPGRDFNGTLLVNAVVSDGAAPSPVAQLTVFVTAVNDAPLITRQAGSLSTPEDAALTLTLAALQVSDPDNVFPQDFTLQVLDGSNYTRVGNTVTPVQDFNGTLQVPVRVNDGQLDSPIFTLSVTVTPVNDAPWVSSQVTLAIDEETPFTLRLDYFGFNDVDDQPISDYSLQVLDGSNYTRVGNTVTPVVGFVGTLTVLVTVSDGTATSAPFGAQVTVRQVNKPPRAGADAYRTSANTELIVSAAAGVLVNDSDRETGVALVGFDAISANGSNVQVNADGSLLFRPKAGFVGTDTFTYTVKETGGTQTATGTVSVAVVGPRIWYVNNAMTISGDGRSHLPFQTLAAAQAASGTGDVLFVYRGSGAAYGNVVLKPDQALVGEAAGLVRPENPAIAPGGRPVIGAGSGPAVTLASRNQVRGLDVVNASGSGVVGASVESLSLVGVGVSAANNGVALTGTGSGQALLQTVSVSTTNGSALTATGFSTLTIPDSQVTVSAQLGPALDLASIGTLDATVRSLSSTRSTSHGVRLEGVGGTFTVQQPITISKATTTGMLVKNSSGTYTLPRLDVQEGVQGLVVDGFGGTFTVGPTTGAAGSGGNISATSGEGVVLADAVGITLRRLKVSSTGGDGLRVPDGRKVTGLVLTDSLFYQTGNTPNAHALNFGRGAATGSAQLEGTVQVTNTTLEASRGAGLFLENGGGSLTLVLDGLTVQGTGTASPGVLVRADSSRRTSAQPQVTLTVDNASISGVPVGANGLDLATEGGAATLTATVEDSFFHNSVGQGASAVRLSADGTGAQLTAFVRRNSVRNWNSHALLLQGGDEGTTLRATVENNTIGSGTDATVVGSASGNGIYVLMDADPGTSSSNGRVALRGNIIGRTGAEGIKVVARQGTSLFAHRLDLTLIGNRVTAPTLADAVRLTVSDTTTLCAAASANTLTPAPGYSGLALVGQAPASFLVQGVGSSPTPSTVESYLAANNTANPLFAFGAFQSATACLTP